MTRWLPLSMYALTAGLAAWLAACGGGGGGCTPTHYEVTVRIHNASPYAVDRCERVDRPGENLLDGRIPIASERTIRLTGTYGCGYAPRVKLRAFAAGTESCWPRTVDVERSQWQPIWQLAGEPTCGEGALAPPVLHSLQPGRSSLDGLPRQTLRGAYFAAGETSVTVGGEPVRSLEVVSEGELRFLAPVREQVGTFDVVVTTPRGSATLAAACRYIRKVYYAAIGSTNDSGWVSAMDAERGWLHTVREAPAGSTLAFDAMAFAPDGTAYAASRPAGDGLPGTLYALGIDGRSFTRTAIGDLTSADGAPRACTDMTFVGERLYGVDRRDGTLIEIDPDSGEVVTIAPLPGPAAGGGALAADATGAVYYMDGDAGHVHEVDVETGAFTAGPLLAEGALGEGCMLAATFHEGVLYAIWHTEHPTFGEDGATQLVRVRPWTGAFWMTADISDWSTALASPVP